MILFLTGSPTRYGEDRFTMDNGFLDEVKAALPENPSILLISAAPDDPDFTKYVKESMAECIRRSGIAYGALDMLERHNASSAASLVASSDFVILCGGHVPTQNRFFHEIGLADILKAYDGVVMGCSAGSMNCARRVYSHPELPGESIDPAYERWLPGLGLVDINIVPHLGQVRSAIIDGRRLFEDVIFPDSYGHRFITFRDGGYIVCRGTPGEMHCILRGEAWSIENGLMHHLCNENESYSFMNVIFISPHFPETYAHFCAGLRRNGVRVLGVADTNYENLSEELRHSLTDYYKVNDLENYDEVFKAVAYFSFKYGKIDWIESNNEYWLEQDARLRTDFNVNTGFKTDRIASIKEKSRMKEYYAKGGIPTARQIKGSEGLEAVKSFAAKTGYPIIAKPDNGVGAEGTFKLHDDGELEAWFASHPNSGAFVLEEFITGLLVSYDAIFNSKGEPVFENNSVFPTPIMDIVNKQLDIDYYTNKTVPPSLAEIGRRTVKAFGVTGRFVHLEYFQLDRDREGLGKKGDYVGLEVNMRPPGGFTPDMMNFAHSTDVFQIWADMVAFDERRKPLGDSRYCAYAGRRDIHSYKHSREEILARYGSSICMYDRVPKALSSALCDEVYMALFSTKKEMDAYFKFVQE